MRGELPQFKRCCMCLPLRHGLILWGYIRLLIGGLLLIGSTDDFIYMLAVTKTDSGYNILSVVMFGCYIILSGTDIVLNVVFVIAEHTKDLQLLKVYYIYSFIIWILTTILTSCLVVYGLQDTKWHKMDFLNSWVTLCNLLTLAAQILVHAYILLLLRSEFIKQTTNCEVRFVNNAAESARSMKCIEDNIINEDQ